jgi:CHAT domain-containing protein/tetratricopeptide (TPR) repeat protein
MPSALWSSAFAALLLAGAAPLEVGQAVERPLRGGERHAYSLSLAAGQYLDASLDPHGVMTYFTLLAGGQTLFEEELPGGTGPKSIEWVAEGAGEYRLEVRSTSIPAKQGRYRLELKALREATATDRTRFAARQALEKGETEFRASQLEAAVKTLEEALALARQAGGEPALEGRVLHWLGQTHRSRGDLARSAEALGQAYELRQGLGPYPRADALLARGLLARARRDYQQALRHDLEAIDLFKQVGARVPEARGYQYLAVVYNDLGDSQNALEALRSVASLWEEEGLFDDQAQALTSMGRIHWQRGEAKEALAHHRRARQIARREKNDRRLADALADLGLTYRLLAEKAAPTARRAHYQRSLRYLEQALEIHTRLKNETGRRIALQGLRRTHESRGEWEKALAYSAQVLGLPGGADWPEFTARARIALRRGTLDEARDWIEKALAAVESSRPRVADHDLQASYEGSLSHLFDLQVDILMRLHQRDPAAGLDWAAFQASERGRARALLDNVRASQGRGAAGADPGLAAREGELFRAAEVLGERAAQPGLSDAERAAVQSDLQRTLSQLQAVRVQVDRGQRQQALTEAPAPRLADVQALLDGETLLLVYDLGRERSYLFAVTKASWRSFALPADSELEGRARRLPELLSRRAGGVTPGGAKAFVDGLHAADRQFAREGLRLGEILFGPVPPGPEVKRLVLVWDGALHYLPVAGMPLPRSWGGAAAGPLAARYEIVTLPSVSLVAALGQARSRREPPRKRVAVFADPVFDDDDPRLSARQGAAPARPPLPPVRGRGLIGGDPAPRLMAMSGAGLTRLPLTAALAADVIKSVPAGEGLAAVGFEATREAALSPDLADYGTVVFATHAYLDEDYPALSGIVLSLRDAEGRPLSGIVRQHDVYRMSLNADLVVLAGCETALGKQVRGEGLLGLSRGFFYAGASRVVASLWKVEEQATVELIRNFLRRTQEGQAPAAALRDAQLSLSREARWRAPYFWAGFVLQGDWR